MGLMKTIAGVAVGLATAVTGSLGGHDAGNYVKAERHANRERNAAAGMMQMSRKIAIVTIAVGLMTPLTTTFALARETMSYTEAVPSSAIVLVADSRWDRLQETARRARDRAKPYWEEFKFVVIPEKPRWTRRGITAVPSIGGMLFKPRCAGEDC